MSILLRLLSSGFAAGCVLWLLGACATTPQGDSATPVAAGPQVILISIDGFRADYLRRGVSPNLDRLAEEGASGPMRPSFPSVTFPNHYTLVTGLHPDHHGIVGNRFIDAGLGRFTMAGKETGWWDQAEPIWITAERAGLRTATMFWPGSETEIGGLRPTYWRSFDQTVSSVDRVGQVLSWQGLPAAERPRLTTLYFDIVDTAGHHYGPEASETRDAVAEIDAAIGRLMEGLQRRDLIDDTVLIIVSDHGMAATHPDRVIRLEDLVPADAIDVIYSGAAVFLNPLPGREAEVLEALARRHAHGECWERASIPARFVLGSNPRVPAIVCAADPGWLMVQPGWTVDRPGGAHGYDNQAPEMQALFVAHGPGVVTGARLRNLDSVDVQPLIGRLLGIPVPPGDGDPDDTLPVTIP